jgi:hypothetical protein
LLPHRLKQLIHNQKPACLFLKFQQNSKNQLKLKAETLVNQNQIIIMKMLIWMVIRKTMLVLVGILQEETEVAHPCYE